MSAPLPCGDFNAPVGSWMWAERQLGQNSKFGDIKREPFTIIISNKDKKLYNNNTWNWSLGITRNNTIIIKDPSKSHITKTRLMQVLQHELNHVYLNRLNSLAEIPRWFKEGFSMYYANENFLSNKLIIANNIKKNDMFNIEAMESRFHSHSKKQFNFAYAYSQAAVKNILDVHGEQAIQDIILYIKKDYAFDNVPSNLEGTSPTFKRPKTTF